ncbi:MAG: glutamate-5-semialdehyde dehydrogenase [Opitutaceae bacterium]|nr:glutamate-5-semialdehyde dehydrogenase [Opitutaceae bacterium]
MPSATAPIASTDDHAALALRLGRAARAASLVLANVPTERKNAALLRLAALIDESAAALAETNTRDLAAGAEAGLAPAMLDRLKLTPARIAQMAEGVRQVAALPDPVGDELERFTRPDGLEIRKVRVPIGVIAIIYESRPNVTIDCAALCLKSGNASILRGGKEAFHSNTALAALIARALAETGLPADAVQLMPTTDRAALTELLKRDDLIHCVIPRGGEGLIRFVAQNSRIPVIKHYKGVCSIYLHRDADAAMASAIAVNAKVQRPSVCNAAEKLLVHRDAAPSLLPVVGRALAEKKVELRCDPEAARILTAAGLATKAATETDWDEEYLDLIIAVKVVDDLPAAVDFINTHGSAHSDAIITGDAAAAEHFLNTVDSAAVFWNASTRFNDGFEFGLGAEIGISTDRLHARGPMGLRELCTYKFRVVGRGHVRG